jgi:hypothetical protein
MQSVIKDFELQKNRILCLVEVINASMEVGKTDDKTIRSKAAFVIASKRLKAMIVTNITPVAYDGAYLTACAEYEQAVRSLIDRFVAGVVSKCTSYQHLPRKMRDWYPDGCSNIILNIKQDKFNHLTKDAIVNSLSSCSKTIGYTLLGEPFSDNPRNFRADYLEEILTCRIGIEKIWQKVSRETDMHVIIGSTDPSTAERVAREKLNIALQRRNDLVHRGRSYYSPSASEVKECVSFLNVLVATLGNIMIRHLAAI